MMDILINTYDTMAKILLVEDEVNIASLIERGLRELGHEVYVAYDGAAGWELTQKNDFQLLILDIIKISNQKYKITGLVLFAIFLRPGYYIWRAHVLKRKMTFPIIYTIAYSGVTVAYFFYSFYKVFSLTFGIMQSLN